MLIRTQNKRILIDTENTCSIYCYDGIVYAKPTKANLADFALGIYDTPEKAMGVLDEIQENMCTSLEFTQDSLNFKLAKICYQIPENDAVFIEKTAKNTQKQPENEQK